MRSGFGRLAALALACAFIVPFGRAVAVEEPFGRLSADEVAAKLGKPGVHVYDNNSRERYDTGHVPGATWLDYDKVTAASLPSDKGATLIFYCANEH